MREAAIELVHRSCAEQGLAVKVTDRRTLDGVAHLLVESRDLRD